MRGLVVAVATAALLGGTATGVAGQDVDIPPSTEALYADYVIEEVEPGVLALSYVPGRLDDHLRPWADIPPAPTGEAVTFAVAPDGTVWRAGLYRSRKQQGQREKDRRWFTVIHSFDGEGWTEHKRVRSHPHHGPLLDIGPDGTVWASWVHAERESENVVFKYGPDGWLRVEPVVEDDDLYRLHATDDGVVWMVGDGLYRYVDGAWQGLSEAPERVTVGADGTVWGIDGRYGQDARLLRLDGEVWQQLAWPRAADGTAMDQGPFLTDGAPDGSLWLALWRSPAHDDVPTWSDRSVGCEGVVRYDGRKWDRYLPGLCADGLWVAPDGAVLVSGVVRQSSRPGLREATYLIRPQSVEPPAE